MTFLEKWANMPPRKAATSTAPGVVEPVPEPETILPIAAPQPTVADLADAELRGRVLGRQAQAAGLPLTWRCYTCGASGTLQRAATETCDVTWARVLAAHAVATPGCHHSGLAVKDGSRQPRG